MNRSKALFLGVATVALMSGRAHAANVDFIQGPNPLYGSVFYNQYIDNYLVAFTDNSYAVHTPIYGADAFGSQQGANYLDSIGSLSSPVLASTTVDYTNNVLGGEAAVGVNQDFNILGAYNYAYVYQGVSNEMLAVTNWGDAAGGGTQYGSNLVNGAFLKTDITPYIYANDTVYNGVTDIYQQLYQGTRFGSTPYADVYSFHQTVTNFEAAAALNGGSAAIDGHVPATAADVAAALASDPNSTLQVGDPINSVQYASNSVNVAGVAGLDGMPISVNLYQEFYLGDPYAFSVGPYTNTYAQMWSQNFAGAYSPGGLPNMPAGDPKVTGIDQVAMNSINTAQLSSGTESGSFDVGNISVEAKSNVYGGGNIFGPGNNNIFGVAYGSYANQYAFFNGSAPYASNSILATTNPSVWNFAYTDGYVYFNNFNNGMLFDTTPAGNLTGVGNVDISGDSQYLRTVVNTFAVDNPATGNVSNPVPNDGTLSINGTFSQVVNDYVNFPYQSYYQTYAGFNVALAQTDSGWAKIDGLDQTAVTVLNSIATGDVTTTNGGIDQAAIDYAVMNGNEAVAWGTHATIDNVTQQTSLSVNSISGGVLNGDDALTINQVSKNTGEGSNILDVYNRIWANSDGTGSTAAMSNVSQLALSSVNTITAAGVSGLATINQISDNTSQYLSNATYAYGTASTAIDGASQAAINRINTITATVPTVQ